MTSGLQPILRDLENTIADLRWADRPSFHRHIKKLSRLLHSEGLDQISCELSEGVDLDAWLKTGEATQSSMVGSAILEWPNKENEELGLVVALIDRFASNPDSAHDFAHTFYYAGSIYTLTYRI